MAIDTKNAKLNQEQGEDQTDSLAFALWKSWPYGTNIHISLPSQVNIQKSKLFAAVNVLFIMYLSRAFVTF